MSDLDYRERLPLQSCRICFLVAWAWQFIYSAGDYVQDEDDAAGQSVGINLPSTAVDRRTMNGSTVTSSPQTVATQGYDGAMYGSHDPYRDPALNVALSASPSHSLQLPADFSLASTISITAAGNRPQLQTAAILRPWIDHVPNGLRGYHHPASNIPNYGREIVTQVGIGPSMPARFKVAK